MEPCCQEIKELREKHHPTAQGQGVLMGTITSHIVDTRTPLAVPGTEPANPSICPHLSLSHDVGIVVKNPFEDAKDAAEDGLYRNERGKTLSDVLPKLGAGCVPIPPRVAKAPSPLHPRLVGSY